MALGLFFLGSFALIIGAISVPSIEFYTGGIVIALFIAGLFYSWFNSIRQGRKVGQRAESRPETPDANHTTLEEQRNAMSTS